MCLCYIDRIDNLKALCSGTMGEDEKAFSKVIKVDAERKEIR